MAVRINYYLQIESSNSVEKYVYFSTDSEVNPFVSPDDSHWEKTDYIPDTVILIKAEQKASGADTETLFYYYEAVPSKTPAPATKNICKNCNSCVEKSCHGQKIYLCKNKNNSGIDYVSGKQIYEPCYKFNATGLCPHFSEISNDEN